MKFIEKIEECIKDIEQEDTYINEVVDSIWNAAKEHKNIFIIGNGGSAYTASHFALDLNHSIGMKIKAISLSENSGYITAVGNDNGFEHIFSFQIDNLATPGDLLIAFSCSGQSKNILEALSWAYHRDIKTILMTGNNYDENFNIKERVIIYNSEPFIIESIFSVLCHMIVQSLRERLTEEVFNA